MQIKTYTDLQIKVLDKTPIAKDIWKTACDITQKETNDLSGQEASKQLIENLYTAQHHSIFEHASITFMAVGISRSLLAQVTRQRTFKFTSASQHFQDYRDYPMVLRKGWDEDKVRALWYSKALDTALESYIRLIELGEPHAEARQVLPNACAVNLIITADPRNLMHFLNTRLCWRNTNEMLWFAREVKKACVRWIPELFELAKPFCENPPFTCNQGKMTCGRRD